MMNNTVDKMWRIRDIKKCLKRNNRYLIKCNMNRKQTFFYCQASETSSYKFFKIDYLFIIKIEFLCKFVHI